MKTDFYLVIDPDSSRYGQIGVNKAFSFDDSVGKNNVYYQINFIDGSPETILDSYPNPTKMLHIKSLEELEKVLTEISKDNLRGLPFRRTLRHCL